MPPRVAAGVGRVVGSRAVPLAATSTSRVMNAVIIGRPMLTAVYHSAAFSKSTGTSKATLFFRHAS
jgi:hypothetical protein